MSIYISKTASTDSRIPKFEVTAIEIVESNRHLFNLICTQFDISLSFDQILAERPTDYITFTFSTFSYVGKNIFNEAFELKS